MPHEQLAPDRPAFSLLWIFYLVAIVAAGLGAFGPALGVFLVTVVVVFRALHFQARTNSGSDRRRLVAATISWTALFLAILVQFFFLPNVTSTPSRRNMCLNNMKQLLLAIQNYTDTNGHLPPPYSVDANGKPLHSWRVLLLPYMEGNSMYEDIRYDEPWNSPHNRQFASLMPEEYRCPSCMECDGTSSFRNVVGDANTPSYFAVVADTTCWPPNGTRKYDDITDGFRNTVLLVESAQRHVNWMEPVDLTLGEAVDLLADRKRLRHVSGMEGWVQRRMQSNGGNLGFVDSHAEYIGAIADRQRATDLLTIADGRPREPPETLQATPATIVVTHWGRIVSLGVFALLTALPWRWFVPKHL